MSGRFHFSPPLSLLPKGCHWPTRTSMAIGPHPLPAYFPPIRANTGHLTVSNASTPPTELRLKLESLAMAAKPPVTWCPLPLGTHLLPLSPCSDVGFPFCSSNLWAVSCFRAQNTPDLGTESLQGLWESTSMSTAFASLKEVTIFCNLFSQFGCFMGFVVIWLPLM